MASLSNAGESGRELTKGRRPSRHTPLGRAPFRIVWLALGLAAAASCGGTTDGDGTGGTSGAGTGGEDGEASGGSSSTDASGGRSASGGTGSDPSGGASSGGASGSGTGGDEPGTGGLGGATSSEHLVDLGDECETPGEFACSVDNEILALICGGDGEWEVLETCDDGERCDAFNAATAGTCRAVLPECESGSDEPFCTDTGTEVCNPGGFDKEVLDECFGTEVCLPTGCIPGPDSCLSGAYGCGGDCGVNNTVCVLSGCVVRITLYLEGFSEVVRLSNEPHCPAGFTGCPGLDPRQVEVHSIEGSDFHPEHWIRVTMERGWEMYPRYVDDSEDSSCRAGAEECLVLEPADFSGTPSSTSPQRFVNFYPLTDPPLPRNVHFEIVPEGTTCD